MEDEEAAVVEEGEGPEAFQVGILLKLLDKGPDDDVRFRDIIQLTPAIRCFDAFGSLLILSAWGSLELPSICSILSWSRNPFTVTFLIINLLKSRTDVTFICKFVLFLYVKPRQRKYALMSW